MSTQSWQTAEIPGPKHALVLTKPETAAALIKKAKKVLLVVGSEALNTRTKDGDLIDSAIRIGRTRKADVALTAHMISESLKRGYEGGHSISLFGLADRLRDPDWMGLEGKGRYDLVLFVGFSYYYEWLALSGLKHFAEGLQTISLERFYQPNAGWSFPNTQEQKWEEYLDKIIAEMEVSK